MKRSSLVLSRGVVVAVVGLLLAASLLAQKQPTRAESEIRAVLEAQVAAWNRGDIEGFMAGYWKSEKTTFLSSSGVSRGWQALLERYKRGYPDKKTMGTLAFSEIEINLLGREAAFILGRWQLEREKDGKPDRPGGVFTLVARKFPEGWRIVSDHTSSVATPK
ncbi:MAG: nuclear transport factor 2 family protein [Acidobacteria bacterium]|nr:nuclear transport factor 2 family protein [Acidobacteriota bacterium]MCL5289370.1 nuclear transport factor 2 family protein [Acidobacteriota bacterium]